MIRLVLPLLVALASGLAASAVPAQVPLRAVALGVDASSGAAEIQLRGILDDPALQAAVDEGLPLRVRITTELWRDRFLFDGEVAVEEWRASVLRDPLTRRFRAIGESGPVGAVEGVTTLGQIGDLLHEAFELRVGPQEEGSYYYRVRVEIETLSPNDLEELRRWLRGDLAPAVGGDDQVEDALFRGLGRVFVRMLQLPSRSYQLTSSTFRFTPGGSPFEFGPASAKVVGTPATLH